jgi:mannose-6-phosphate isomerase-like protein (cupin superfamily)
VKHRVRAAQLERTGRGDRGLDRPDAAEEHLGSFDARELALGGSDDQDHGRTVSIYDLTVAFRVADIGSLTWDERPPKEGEGTRLAADITTQAGLQQSRARVWRYPPHTTGRRHADHAQEEVFVVVSGTLTMLLGDEPERVDVGPGSVVAVDAMTPLQMRNETDEELVCFVYGAPPVQDGADFLDDVALPAKR